MQSRPPQREPKWRPHHRRRGRVWLVVVIVAAVVLAGLWALFQAGGW